MKICITGAGGQLGTDCRRALSGEHELFCFSSTELDISGEEQVSSTIARVQPELIINCAAYTAVDRCESDTGRCFAVNGEGPGLLARAAKSCGARLIHISTDYVFAGNKPVPQAYREDDPVGPLSAYGRSKLAGEEAVRRHCDNHLIIRTAWLYGREGKNFLKTMLRLALADPDRTIRVVDDQFGSMTWTWRLAQQIRELLTSDLRGTIHATAEGYGSWFAVAGCFLDAMGLDRYSLAPCTTADYPTPTHRPANSILENGILKEQGRNLMRPWQDDVREFAARFRAELLAEATS